MEKKTLQVVDLEDLWYSVELKAIAPWRMVMLDLLRAYTCLWTCDRWRFSLLKLLNLQSFCRLWWGVWIHQVQNYGDCNAVKTEFAERVVAFHIYIYIYMYLLFWD